MLKAASSIWSLTQDEGLGRIRHEHVSLCLMDDRPFEEGLVYMRCVEQVHVLFVLPFSLCWIQCCHIPHNPAPITLVIVTMTMIITWTWTSQGCLVLHIWVHIFCNHDNHNPACHQHNVGLEKVI